MFPISIIPLHCVSISHSNILQKYKFSAPSILLRQDFFTDLSYELFPLFFICNNPDLYSVSTLENSSSISFIRAKYEYSSSIMQTNMRCIAAKRIKSAEANLVSKITWLHVHIVECNIIRWACIVTYLLLSCFIKEATNKSPYSDKELWHV